VSNSAAEYTKAYEEGKWEFWGSRVEAGNEATERVDVEKIQRLKGC
jgi:hypothetical protein